MNRYISYIKQLGYSQKEISEFTNIPRTTLRRHIAGKPLPDKYDDSYDLRLAYKRASYRSVRDLNPTQAKRVSGGRPSSVVERKQDLESSINSVIEERWAQEKQKPKHKRTPKWKLKREIKQNMRKSTKRIGEILSSP